MDETKGILGRCPGCGSLLDEEGICTKLKGCRRRKLQLKLKKARQKVEAEKKASEGKN